MIVLAAILFIGAASLLYFRWLHDQEHTSVLVLNGSDALDGATAVIDGIALDGAIRGTFSEENRFTLKLFLQAGSYRFRIVRGDATLRTVVEFSLPRNTMITFNLQRDFPSTRKSSPPTESPAMSDVP